MVKTFTKSINSLTTGIQKNWGNNIHLKTATFCSGNAPATVSKISIYLGQK